MYKIINEILNPELVTLNGISEERLDGSIIVAVKGKVKDILICTQSRFIERVPHKYEWRSLYVRKAKRNWYHSIKEAIESRLRKSMQVYVCSNRKEFIKIIQEDCIKVKNNL